MTSPKEIIFEEQAREKLLAGIERVVDVIQGTVGPKGRNVALEKWGSPSVSNDGRSIVKDLEFQDKYENMGANMAKEVAEKVNEKTGDGSTTALLILRSLVQRGLAKVTSGISPINLKRGMEKAVKEILSSLEKSRRSISSSEEIRNIATVSASHDASVGETIAQAVEKVGRDGVITIEESKTTQTSIDLVEGMQFDRGYSSPYFCTDADKTQIEMQDAQLLLVDKKLSSIQELLPVLQASAATGKELLIIAEDFEGDVISTLVVNRLRGTLKVTAVKAPGFGDRRKEMLEDIASLVGATVISEDKGMQLKDCDTAVLGSAEKVTVDKENTTIVGGAGSKENITLRVQQIQRQIEETDSSYDREKLEERKAKLTSGVAAIRVGASTETELKQKKQVFEDSLNATRSAIQSGVLAGGGVALLRARKALDNLNLDTEEAYGVKLVFEACEAPFRGIVDNAGLDSSVILSQVLKSEDQNFGFDVMQEKAVDMLATGIIDSANVIESALLYASSTAGIVFISEVLISDAEEEALAK